MRRLALRTVLLGAAAAAVYLGARRGAFSWGSEHEETTAPLPGDDLVASPGLVATRAITIQAPPDEVWPWVAQLGQGRGGFYSYDALENLFGLDIVSADSILAEHQSVAVGDTIHLAEPAALHVYVADPGRALVVGGSPEEGYMDADEADSAPPMPFSFSWAFVLSPQPGGRTRLVVRERYGWSRPWVALVVEPVEWVSSLMSQRMLRGIRDRAEGRRV